MLDLQVFCPKYLGTSISLHIIKMLTITNDINNAYTPQKGDII